MDASLEPALRLRPVDQFMRLPSFLRRRDVRTRKRRDLERRISLERLELRQMLSANNQPPTVSWGNEGGGSLGLSPGQAHYFSASELGYHDADGDSLDHITILSLPTQGSLSLYSYYPVTSGQSIDAYALNSGYLVYTPDSNAPASYSTTFAFSVNDGQDNSLPTSFTLNVGVTPNTPPTIAGSVHSLPSTSSKTITTADLGYADADGNQLQSITVTALPSTGTLLNYGYPVSVGSTIDAYQFSYGTIVYQPSTTATASYADTFSFTASDGTVSRGRLRQGQQRSLILAGPDSKYFLNSFFELRVRELRRTPKPGFFWRSERCSTMIGGCCCRLVGACCREKRGRSVRGST